MFTPEPLRMSPPPAVKPARTVVDQAREALDTIVFVVALVLMLKLFVVEAFVIPTGSMAETLFGYQKQVHCPHCDYVYPVNASYEVEPPDGGPARPVLAGTCPNCRQRYQPKPADLKRPADGDRVLVHKALYSVTGGPERGDVVVFKYPVYPQIKHTAQNYIKRLWGLGGETVAIYRGDLYLHNGLTYPTDAVGPDGRPTYLRPPGGDPTALWEGPNATQYPGSWPRFEGTGNDYTYHNAEAAVAAFDAARAEGFSAPAGFGIVRKSDATALAMRRIVYDNDHQSKTLVAKGVPPRWTAGTGWTPDASESPRVFTHAGDTQDWLRYAHRVTGPPTEVRDGSGNPVLGPTNRVLVVDDTVRVEGGYTDGLFPPGPVTNFLGYNTTEELDQDLFRMTGQRQAAAQRTGNGDFWVPDLMLECEATISSPADAVTLDLAKSGRRMRATFAGGTVALTCNGQAVASAPTRLTQAGRYDLRFAFIDGRLRVAVNGSALAFGPEVDLPPWAPAGAGAALGSIVGAAAAPATDGLHAPSDLSPAAIGAAGAVTISHVKLWADTYFTPSNNPTDRADPVDTYYVQPGHYLCLGDNSGQSSDGRVWGLVPDRLLLGKAQFVFWPPRRVGFIK